MLGAPVRLDVVLNAWVLAMFPKTVQVGSLGTLYGVFPLPPPVPDLSWRIGCCALLLLALQAVGIREETIRRPRYPLAVRSCSVPMIRQKR